MARVFLWARLWRPTSGRARLRPAVAPAKTQHFFQHRHPSSCTLAPQTCCFSASAWCGASFWRWIADRGFARRERVWRCSPNYSAARCGEESRQLTIKFQRCSNKCAFSLVSFPTRQSIATAVLIDLPCDNAFAAPLVCADTLLMPHSMT
jgi:hypothetical protein